jgi:hypothetical protein
MGGGAVRGARLTNSYICGKIPGMEMIDPLAAQTYAQRYSYAVLRLLLQEIAAYTAAHHPRGPYA